MPYKQGLSEPFVKALNELHASNEGDWWRKMLVDPELFVAIRNESLNVYYRGCSLAQVRLEEGRVIARTHYKYLLKSDLQPYVRAEEGRFLLDRHVPGGPAEMFIGTLSDVSSLKAAARKHAGGEKTDVAQIISNHSNVVDVEIALTTEAEGEDGPSAKRLDLCVLRNTKDELTLEFHEAKLFSSKYLRTSSKNSVIDQMSTYTKLLSRYEGDIRNGFIRSCECIRDLVGFPAFRKTLSEEALQRQGSLKVDVRPFLIVIGLDRDHQKDGSIWSGHAARLAEKLGTDRVIVRGKAKDVAIGGGKRPKPKSGLSPL